MDFLDEEYKQLLAKKDDIRAQLKAFVKEHRKDIMAEMHSDHKPYTEEQNRLQEAFYQALNECSNYLQSLSKYMKFDASVLDVLAYLMSNYEGVKYIKETSTSVKKELRFGQKEEYKERLTFITPYYVSSKYMVDRGLVLSKERLAIDDESQMPTEITFYYPMDDGFASKIDFSSFPYVQDFVDNMINYKIKYGKDVPLEAFQAMAQQFLDNRMSTIMLYQATKLQKGPLNTIGYSLIDTGMEEEGPKL